MAETLFEIEIPGLPKPINRLQVHWRNKHAHAKRWKDAVILYTRKYKPDSAFEKASLTLTRISSKRPDFDGLVSSFKHVIDGLIEAGIIINDTHDVIGVPDYQWEKGKQKLGMIRIKVEV